MSLTSKEIRDRLLAGWPGVGWSLDGECIKGLIWPEHAGPKPTMKQIKAVVLPPPPAREVRAAAYRDDLGGFADMLHAIIQEMRARGEPISDAFSELAKKIDDIDRRASNS